jgi:hypothetical protein
MFVCLFDFGATAPSGQRILHSLGYKITHNHATQSVGLLWKSDQVVTETYIWQHTTITRNRHLCPGVIRTHNLSRRAGRKPTPETARPLRPAILQSVINNHLSLMFILHVSTSTRSSSGRRYNGTQKQQILSKLCVCGVRLQYCELKLLLGTQWVLLT